MKVSVVFFLIILFPFSFFAQSKISGIVTDKKGVPIFGANVYLTGTYDGTTSNQNGNFTFETTETGVQTLTVSYVSFETFTMIDDVSKLKNLKVILRDDVNSLGTVTISAGSFFSG